MVAINIRIMAALRRHYLTERAPRLSAIEWGEVFAVAEAESRGELDVGDIGREFRCRMKAAELLSEATFTYERGPWAKTGTAAKGRAP
jgi:hypothetical protein